MIGRVVGTRVALVVAALACAAPAAAQQASFAHMLGKDTMAVEQYTRSGNLLAGEVVTRLGAAVTRLQYEVTLGRDGRPVSAVYRQRNAAGASLPSQPGEIRLTFAGDSVKREAVFPDSVSTRTFRAVRGVPFQSPAFGLYETAFAQLRRGREKSVAFALVGTGAGLPQAVTFAVGAGDTIRATNSIGLVTVLLVDRDGRLQAVDATNTTQKLVSTRAPGGADLAAIAGRMTPTGTLSARGAAFASFMQSAVFINYGRPQVRERTAWGGVLIPHDTIWRAGANEATHLATGRELAFGDVVVPPGLYTLFIYNARGGPQLVINRQVGQWGTGYDPARDLGRVPMKLAPTPQHVEEYTITIRSLGGGRGAIDFAWGPQVAAAEFTAR